MNKATHNETGGTGVYGSEGRGMTARRTQNAVSRKLSTLWIFVTLNYLYCDVMSLMDRSMLKQYLTGNVGGVHISQGFLLGSAVLMEIPIAMVVLAWTWPDPNPCPKQTSVSDTDSAKPRIPSPV
jgi:hypothetical protein